MLSAMLPPPSTEMIPVCACRPSESQLPAGYDTSGLIPYAGAGPRRLKGDGSPLRTQVLALSRCASPPTVMPLTASAGGQIRSASPLIEPSGGQGRNGLVSELPAAVTER